MSSEEVLRVSEMFRDKIFGDHSEELYLRLEILFLIPDFPQWFGCGDRVMTSALTCRSVPRRW